MDFLNYLLQNGAGSIPWSSLGTGLGAGVNAGVQGFRAGGADLHGWLNSLLAPSPSPAASPGGFNPTAGLPMSFAPAVGAGGTGAGTGSGVGPWQPTTATPSLGELTGVPEAGAPGMPSGVQQPIPYAAPSGAASPGGYADASGGWSMPHPLNQALLQFPQQWLAQMSQQGQSMAQGATADALQRAAAYRASLFS